MAQKHLDELDRLLGGFFIKYQPLLGYSIGVNEAIILCNLIYWYERRSNAAAGWFYKSAKEMHQETGLKRAAQDLAIRNLIKRGYLELRHGILNKRMFKVNFDVLVKQIPSLLETDKLDWLVKKNKSALNKRTTTKSPQRFNNKDNKINYLKQPRRGGGLEKVSSVIARNNYPRGP